MLTTLELAELLGWSLSETQTVTRSQNLADCKIGKNNVIDEEKLEEYARVTLPNQIATLKERLAKKEAALPILEQYLQNREPNPSAEQAYITVNEMCQLTGNLKFFFYKLIRAGELEHKEVGHQYLIPRNAFIMYCDRNAIPIDRDKLEELVRDADTR